MTPTPDRTPLTRERILDAAIDLADRDGLRSLSMRKLAKALGFEVMSLYNHVANKGDLLDGMVDEIVGRVPYPAPDTGWRDAIKQNTLGVHEVYQAHPWAAALVASRLPGPNRIEQMEWQLATFASSDLPEPIAHHAFHAVNNHLLGYSLAAEQMPGDDDAEEMIETFVARLDRERHAHMLHHIQQHLEPEDDQPTSSFELVLDLILDGLERSA